MINNELEVFITNNEDLDKLLNKDDIAGFADFSNLEFNNTEFKDYIEQRYIKSFKNIYKKILLILLIILKLMPY